jgi:adenylate cyclase
MGEELERKFLVVGEGWRQGSQATDYRQGFLSTVPERTVRVRVAGNRGWITVKGLAEGLRRPEFEYEIPVGDAQQMLERLCERPLIEKRRHRLTVAGHVWEVDVFGGDNAGLVVAEIELRSEDESFEKPAWLGREVTGDPRYFNANLVVRPFRSWSAEGS